MSILKYWKYISIFGLLIIILCYNIFYNNLSKNYNELEFKYINILSDLENCNNLLIFQKNSNSALEELNKNCLSNRELERELEQERLDIFDTFNNNLNTINNGKYDKIIDFLNKH